MNNVLGLDLMSCLIFRPGLCVASLTLICQQHFILAPSLFFIFIPPARSLLLLLLLSFSHLSCQANQNSCTHHCLAGCFYEVIWWEITEARKKRKDLFFYFSRCQLDEEGGSTCRLGQGDVCWRVVLNQAASILCCLVVPDPGAESSRVQPGSAKELSAGWWCWIQQGGDVFCSMVLNQVASMLSRPRRCPSDV